MGSIRVLRPDNAFWGGLFAMSSAMATVWRYWELKDFGKNAPWGQGGGGMCVGKKDSVIQH